MKVFRLIFIIGEELVMANRGKDIHLKRALFNLRSTLSSKQTNS